MRGKNNASVRLGAVLAVLLLLLGGILAFSENVWPSADGDKVEADGLLRVDYSHAADGYVMVKGKKGDKRLKLRVKCGDHTLTYDINNKGSYEVIPLQYGSGNYRITIYRNVSGNKYSEEGAVAVKVKLKNEDAPFLCPNQYVNYSKDSAAVEKSRELCAGKKNSREKFEAVRNFMEHNFVYDYIRAVTMSGTVLPDIDGCFKKKMGICQDLAAITVCMLRSQGVPAKLMIGYVGEAYHAWVSVNIDGTEQMYDPTAAVGAINKNASYSVERYY